jgi:hypothetical protein
MASLSDLDTLSESEYDSSQDSTSEIDEDSNDDNETLKPERNAPWDPTAQLHAAQLHANELHARQLAQLHAKIKAQAELPIPTYLKLPQR